MFFHALTRSLLFKANDPAKILQAMPAKEIYGQPGVNVAAKHTDAATVALRKMGHDAPSPITAYYNWPGKWKPFTHQKAMAEFMVLHNRCFNLSEMGTGKTAASLWAADWLMKEKRAKKFLILAPLSTLESVWQHGIFDVLMHRRAVIVHGSREKRRLALATDSDFYILNHDGVSIGEVRDLINNRKDITHIIVDEGSMFRNSNTDKWRGLEKVIGKTRGLWWLGATPCPNGPDDCWAQCKLVCPDNVPKFYGAFRRRVMMEVSEHVWKPRNDGYKIAYEAMQPAIRFFKADCLDLPPVTTEDWECELSPDQARAFKSMATQMKMEDNSLKSKGQEITAVNAADKIIKLRQICLGAVKNGDDYSTLNFAPRLKVLKQAIEQANAKVIIVVPFKGAIRALQIELSKTHTVGVINGDVGVSQRNKIISDFKTTPNPHILLCHPKVMSHGLNLTEADVLIFYGPIYSNDEYRQVIERFNRPGQIRKMTIIRIRANALEKRIYDMPDTREVTQTSILNLYRMVLDDIKMAA